MQNRLANLMLIYIIIFLNIRVWQESDNYISNNNLLIDKSQNIKVSNITESIIKKNKYYTPEMFGGTQWESCQRAIDAACLSNGVVKFKRGETYTLDSKTLVVWGSNVKIEGYGATINCVGSPGYYGGAILVIGKKTGTQYYGYLNNNNYNSRSVYTGLNEKSKNVIIKGFEKFKFADSLEGTAMNGISVGNCENVKITDCSIEDVPQTAFVAVATKDEEIDVTFENCLSNGSKSHAYRIISYDVTKNTRLKATLIKCKAIKTFATNMLFSNSLNNRTDVDVYLRGLSLGNRYNIKMINCHFTGGIYDPYMEGNVTVENVKYKYYN